jgi:hypothetical protein
MMCRASTTRWLRAGDPALPRGDNLCRSCGAGGMAGVQQGQNGTASGPPGARATSMKGEL